MSIEVNRVQQEEEFWAVDLKIFEGVYTKEHYPVQVVDVPLPPLSIPDEEQAKIIVEFALQQVRIHMRRGSLPPRGVQISGADIWQESTRS